MRFLTLAALSLLMASPAHANGCKFVSAYALACSTPEGSVSMYFNGERWSEPVLIRTPYQYQYQYQYQPRYRYPRYYWQYH